MKKIGILALATTKHGGTFQYTLSMIGALKLLGNTHCEIFTTEENHEYDDLQLPVNRLPKRSKVISGTIFNMLLPGKPGPLFNGVDIVVSPIYSTYLLATQRPFVFTLHDLQEKYYPQNFSLMQRIWRQLTNKVLINRAGAVICESNYVKKDIVRFFGAQENKIFVMPAPPAISSAENCYSTSRLNEIRREYSLPEKYLFYPAQFWPHKNHCRLIRAFAQVQEKYPECHLVLTGKKRDEFGRVFRLIRELGIAAKVVHVEHVAQADLGAIYQLATAVVIPTLFESISIPAYEAFIFGSPVCISNVVALPEQVGDAALLFTPTSVEEMAASIEKVLASAPLRKNLISKGKSRIAGLTHSNYAASLKGALIYASGSLDG